VTPAFPPHRYFPPWGVSSRLHQTVLRGQSQRARRLGLLAAALSLPRLRNSCVPHVGQAKRRDLAPKSGLSSEDSSTRGQPRGFRSWFQLCSGITPGTCRGPIKATRSGIVTQRDASGSAWSHFVTVAQCVRPWLPQFGRPAPQHARLASLGIAHDLFLRTGSNHGSARPSRRYRSSTAA